MYVRACVSEWVRALEHVRDNYVNKYRSYSLQKYLHYVISEILDDQHWENETTVDVRLNI